MSGEDNSSAGVHRVPWWVHVHLRYRQIRYMHHLDLNELRVRMGDVVFNVHQINDRSQVTLEPEDPILYYWLARLAEIREEIHLRGEREEDVLQGVLTDRREKYPTRREAELKLVARTVDAYQTPAGPYWVKYGKREHMQAMMESGEVQISPAARYDDPSLDPEVRDRELRRELQLDPQRTEMTAFKPTGEEIGALNPQKINVTKHSRGNYYVYCLTTELRVRHFKDFGEDYDTAVVITDPEAFNCRLTAAIGKKLPGWVQGRQAVQYYDPLLIAPEEINVLTFKHFRYAYQREYRYAWVPTIDPIQDLKPIKLHLGNLEGCADLLAPEVG